MTLTTPVQLNHLQTTVSNAPTYPTTLSKTLSKQDSIANDLVQFSGKTNSHQKKKLAGLLAVLGLLGAACGTSTVETGNINEGNRATSCVDVYISKAAEAIKENMPDDTVIHCATHFYRDGSAKYSHSEPDYSLPMPSQMDEAQLREMVGDTVADQLLSENVDSLLTVEGNTSEAPQSDVVDIIETD